jgi:hypothetical protein
MYNNAYNTNANLPIVNAAYNTAVTGGYGAGINPANPYYQDYASGGGPSQQMQQGLYNQGLSQAGQYAQQVGQYASPMQQQGANTANVGGQYAQQIGQYAVPMQQQGANAASVGGQYAQQIGQYSDPLMQYARQAAANNNLGLSQLGNTASGTYLDPNTNPYMAQMVQAAMDPVTRNYQTSIAPSTDAMFSGGGRYGSGAMAGAVDTGQRNLVRGLSDLSGNLYGQQFARERQAQDAAAQQYGSLYNSGLGLGMQGAQNAANIQQAAGSQFLASQDRALAGLRDAAAAQTGAGNQYLSSQAQAAAGLRDAASTQQAAGNQYWSGQTAAQNAANNYAQGGQFGAGGLNSMFNTGNLAAMDALRMYPQLAGAQNIGAQQQVAAGTGLAGVDQARIADEMARFYGQQKAPWDTLTNMSGLFGQPTGGSSSVSQPYFQNQGANLLSGLTGAASLGNQFGLFGSGGLGGLGGSGLAGIGAGNLTGPAAMAGFDTLGGTIGMGALGADFGGGGAAMASFLPFIL